MVNKKKEICGEKLIIFKFIVTKTVIYVIKPIFVFRCSDFQFISSVM